MEITQTSVIPINIMARRLRVTVRWLKAEAEAGRIPAIRTEKSFLVVPAAVEAALAKLAGGQSDG